MTSILLYYRLHHSDYIGEFIQNYCDVRECPAEITHKIRFVRGRREFVMYVDEKDGVFTLRSTHKERSNVEKKVDIIRPTG